MKIVISKIGGILFLVLMLSQASNAQDNSCERNTSFGEAEICLPQIVGYQECYLHPLVKQLADGTELPSNSILGFYLNDETHGKKDSLGSIKFDDYWKVYAVNGMRDYEVDRKALVEMKSVLANNFIFKNWEDLMKGEVDKLELDVEIGSPTVVHSYSLNEETATYIMVVKYQIEGVESFTMAMAMNLLLLKERLIWMGYYLNYENPNTISKLQVRSNAIVERLMSENSQ